MKTYDDIFFEYFGIFWTVSDIDFKGDILPTCDFFDLSDNLVSQARPFPLHNTGCILDTGSNGAVERKGSKGSGL